LTILARSLPAIFGLFAVLLIAAACSTQGNLRPFQAAGPVWPEAPEASRIQYVGEFSTASDLGIRKSVWDRLVSLWAGPSIQSLARPMAVVASLDGQHIYVADPDAQCVHRYDLRRGRYGCLTRRDGSMLPSPVGLAITESGQLFVADSLLAQVFTLQPGEDELQVLPLDTALQQPTGITWDPASARLYVADTAAHVVRKFAPDGTQVAEIGRHGDSAGEFNYPTYIWPDGGGGLLVTDSLNFRVQHIDEHGGVANIFGELGDAPGNLSRPKGIATDSFGHVYVIDALFQALQIFDRQGKLLLVLGERGQAAGRFWLPNGIFISADDTIYIADSYNRRVQVFRYIGGET